jgi:type I restriction-modification system DNA methylase subunit
MSDVVQKLWGFCHTLRHDGVDYGDYIEQLTYLLFLKMADERDIDLALSQQGLSNSAEASTETVPHRLRLGSIRAPAADRALRPEAGQYPGDRRRPSEAAGLWNREAAPPGAKG